MTVQQNSLADFADLARRGQGTAADALELWTSTIQTGGQQAKNLHRVADDLFSLAEASIVVGREFVSYLSTVLRISATGVDTLRRLTTTSLNAAESATQWVAPSSR
jgi:hypothetical protein